MYIYVYNVLHILEEIHSWKKEISKYILYDSSLFPFWAIVF